MGKTNSGYAAQAIQTCISVSQDRAQFVTIEVSRPLRTSQLVHDVAADQVSMTRPHSVSE